MRLPEDDRGQIYTMEGIVASLILLSVLLFILQSNSIIVPQTERSIDMKLYEKAGDALICLDRSNNDIWSAMAPLSTYVAEWDGVSDMTGLDLDNYIASMLPDQVQYNLDLVYFDSTGSKQDKPVIVHGIPHDNSVVSTRLITINEDEVSSYWRGAYPAGSFPHVVQVKLICWYL